MCRALGGEVALTALMLLTLQHLGIWGNKLVNKVYVGIDEPSLPSQSDEDTSLKIAGPSQPVRIDQSVLFQAIAS